LPPHPEISSPSAVVEAAIITNRIMEAVGVLPKIVAERRGWFAIPVIATS
jgi:hypothetical protein